MEPVRSAKWVMWLLHCLSLGTYQLSLQAYGLGSMSSTAASYGGKGPAFCGLRADGSHTADCFGSDTASVYGAPFGLPFVGLTAGDGFVCGLTLATQQPYCWGDNLYVQAGMQPSTGRDIGYVSICAGDNHLCALRNAIASSPKAHSGPAVDCWGYNMAGSFVDTP
eukprot:c14416_g1_i1 orf=131-628(+)